MKDQWKFTVLEGLSCVGAHMALEMVWSNKRFPTAIKITAQFNSQMNGEINGHFIIT